MQRGHEGALKGAGLREDQVDGEALALLQPPFSFGGHEGGAMNKLLPLAAIGCLSAWVLGGCAATPSPPLGPSTTPDRPLQLGYRLGMGLGDGEPANDMPIPLSLLLRYRLDEVWSVGAGLDYAEGDFEGPAGILGLEQATNEATIDSTATSIQLSAWAERDIAGDSVNRFYGLAGLGIADVDVDDVDGPIKGGGKFDITTDAGTELIAMIGLGYDRELGGAWSFEATARYEQHFAEWDLRDDVSGRENTVDDYGVTVLLFGVTYGF